MRKLMAIDYSTECSGYAFYDIENKKLLNFGVVESRKGKGKNKLEKTLGRLNNMADDLVALLDTEVEAIVIEEINVGRSRKGQKTLCGGHFILMVKMGEWIRKIHYIDSDGRDGWRTRLGIKLTAQERIHNKELKKLNKTLKTKLPDRSIITRKHACIAYVNRTFGLSLVESENDAADAIGIGWGYLHE